ncbi:MAG: hypothetical protein IKP64_07080 [Selenomonadaceae bacterium]|nr:hypothetical protein [Selenomonadaceae bacterium]
MLTAPQHDVFIKCARQISAAALHGYCSLSREADKLNAYNMLLEPPETIRQANAERARQLNKQAFSLRDLWIKADKADTYVNARPQLCTYTSFDGSEQTFVLAGILPDCERAPEDEAQALQAVDEYLAREEAQAS